MTSLSKDLLVAELRGWNCPENASDDRLRIHYLMQKAADVIDGLELTASEFVRMQHDICARLGVDANTDSIDLHERALTAIDRLASEANHE